MTGRDNKHTANHTARAMGISPRTALRIASDLLDANHAALGPEPQTTEDA